ncbi:MAG: hypothetical protein EBR82_69730 [Caulobacteraceae bacterium]|nr:hypothetical protein [Caulobacteraceae bacterium]
MVLALVLEMFPQYLQVKGITDATPPQLADAEAVVVLAALPQQILLMLVMVAMELHRPFPVRP